MTSIQPSITRPANNVNLDIFYILVLMILRMFEDTLIYYTFTTEKPGYLFKKINNITMKGSESQSYPYDP